jgi:AcrR family transcriptional regulator
MSLKETIIHESLKLFSLKGFLSTSIHDIMLAANTSKGGFYNHFTSKEDLFFQVLDEARGIWREKNFSNLDEIENPLEKIKMLLENYKDRYLKDADNFPGGCFFITLSVELNDQRPHLAKEIDKGFIGLKNMFRKLLDQANAAGQLITDVDTEIVTEIIFNSMLGASVSYGANKSGASLDKSVRSIINYLDQLKR